MKQVVMLFSLLACLMLGTQQVQAQSQANAIDKYFQQYVENEDFTVVYISHKLFELLGRLDFDKDMLDLDDDDEVEAIMDIAKDMQGLRILTTDIDTERYYKEAKSKINTKEYEVLMTVRTKDGENVEFLVMEEPNSDIINEFLLLAGGDEFVLMSFVGKLDLKKISRLAKEIED